MRAASCSVSVVSRPASPGATSFGPPEKPAKKCGSTNPVVMRTSASTHSLFSHTGTSAPKRPIQVSDASSRASWLTTRTDESTSSPSIARSSSSVLPRCVPVATSTTTSSSRTSPVELLEQRRHDDLARLRARAVADADRDRAAPRRTTSRSGGPGDRPAQRLEHGRARSSGAAGGMQRLDDGRAVVRQVDREPVAAVRELDLHGRRASSSGGVNASTAGSGPS